MPGFVQRAVAASDNWDRPGPKRAGAVDWSKTETIDYPYNKGEQGELTIDSLTRINGRLNRNMYGYAKAGDWSLGVLWSIAMTYPRGVYGEIGFRNGLSALAFSLAARESGGKVYSMDIGDCESGVSNVAEFGFDDIHTFIKGDSRETDFPEMLDVLYIDGDHTYEGVQADYEKHYDRVKPGGTILFHDPVSWFSGVGRFLNERNIFYIPIGCGIGIQWVPFRQGQKRDIRPEYSDEPVVVSVGD